MSVQEISQLFYAIKLIDQKITKLFETKTGLSVTRYELMLFLKKHQPCLQTEIQEQLQIDQGAVTRHLKILEEKDYVTRRRNPANNREIFVHLTEKANKALKGCEYNHNTLTQIIQPDFTQEDCQQLQQLLIKLEKNIE